jgi:Oxidoreductase family, NAD-binding Rossmann fold/Oxidoreductase family, C-terminal alpha/beta domain
MQSPPVPTRRQFVKSLGAAALTAPFVTRNLLAAPPSGMLRHASFGAAGMAWSDIEVLTSHPLVKLVAVAEVDLNRLENVRAHFPDVKVYQDWRELLDKEGAQLDSVNVSVPDHLHAPIALSAMQLGKHVYCQKPLAHDIHETRMLTEFAREKKLVTQMGIQIHSQKVYRQAVALVQAGAIGKVREVHTWSNKKWGDAGPPPAAAAGVPAGFNWDLWLGGCAERPYVGDTYYHPENWRRRLDFGTGTFGDMGCHIFDPVFEALALRAPLSLRSVGPAPDAWNWAINANIRYVFPGTPFTAGPTIEVTWYDGDNRPPAEIQALVTPAQPSGRKSDPAHPEEDELAQGSILIGTEGVLHIPHIATPKLYPVEKFRDYPLPAVAGSNHWYDWIEACTGGPGRPGAAFDYSGPLTEAVLLGSVAVRFPQTTLEWNSERLAFQNVKAANAHIRRTYRSGWGVSGL